MDEGTSRAGADRTCPFPPRMTLSYRDILLLLVTHSGRMIGSGHFPVKAAQPTGVLRIWR